MRLEKPIVFKNVFNIFEDQRGYLSTIDTEELYKYLPNEEFNFKYQLISYSDKKHTFRGMHYQTRPFSQKKLMVVHRGSIIDFAVNIGNIDNSEVLRFDMSAGDAILIPENYAHGFISLTDETLLQYFLDNVFSEENYKGFNIIKYLNKEFPKLKFIMSEKDKNLSELIS